MTYYDTFSAVIRNGALLMKIIKNYDNRGLFRLSVTREKDIPDCLDEGRLNVYFYVTNDKIYSP